MNENDKPIEAEVVHTQAVAVRPQAPGLPTVADLEQQFALAVRQRELLADYIKKQLVQGKHFYQRGDQKPSLTKEGAEIILLPHNLAPDYEQTGGPDKPPEDGRPYQITVKCTLRRKGDSGSFVGSGIGSAGNEHRTRDGTYTPRQPDKYLCHNATLKMAQKSAMIAATINSTAASEFFTQDMDPGNVPEPDNGPAVSRSKAGKPPPPSSATPPVKRSPAGSTGPKPKVPADAKACLARFIENMDKEDLRQKATQYLIDLAWLMPNEKLEDLPARFTPQTKDQYVSFLAAITHYAATGKAAGKPFLPNEEPEVLPPHAGTRPPKAKEERPAPSEEAVDQPWYKFIVPIPRKGMKRDDYLKHPDTIGELFEARHGTDDESTEMRQRLWGFLNNFTPKPWTGRDGKERPPSKTDTQFREMLDAFGEWFEKHHPGEEL